jgi:hypothetical protein
MLQLRQSSKDGRYNTACKAAKTLTSAIFFDETLIARTESSLFAKVKSFSLTKAA